MLACVRVVTAASRDSSAAVLCALDGALRTLDPVIDAVLVLVPSGEELACVHASGSRGEHFVEARFDRAGATLPARAAQSGHRARLTQTRGAILPGDRDAVAVPLEIADRLAGVVYAASCSAELLACDALVAAAEHAAAPFALALEREADRASATYDALTGLYTPATFREQLRKALAIAAHDPRSRLALWFIDTDRFKQVNDAFGHAAGDLVLQGMAALLRERTQPGIDIAARNGGDEFCALVRAGKTEAIARAQQLCQAVRANELAPGARVSASIGVAAYPLDAAQADQLLEMADRAMYHSKRSGRDRVSFVDRDGICRVYTA